MLIVGQPYRSRYSLSIVHKIYFCDKRSTIGDGKLISSFSLQRQIFSLIKLLNAVINGILMDNIFEYIESAQIRYQDSNNLDIFTWTFNVLNKHLI